MFSIGCPHCGYPSLTRRSAGWLNEIRVLRTVRDRNECTFCVRSTQKGPPLSRRPLFPALSGEPRRSVAGPGLRPRRAVRRRLVGEHGRLGRKRIAGSAERAHHAGSRTRGAPDGASGFLRAVRRRPSSSGSPEQIGLTRGFQSSPCPNWRAEHTSQKRKIDTVRHRCWGISVAPLDHRRPVSRPEARPQAGAVQQILRE